MNETLPRVRAGQPVADDGSCWRSLAERQQAECTRATFIASQSLNKLNSTASAHLIGESEDPKPEPLLMYFPEPVRVSGWLLFVAGAMLGAVACAWVMTP